MNTSLACIPRKGSARRPRRPFVLFLSLPVLAAGLLWSAPASSAPKHAASVVFTNKAAFEAALDATSPGTRSNINWDGISFTTRGTKTLAPNAFAARGILLDTDPLSSDLLVSNASFSDLNANYSGDFPTFSPQVNFKNNGDGPQKNTFVLADRVTPALSSAFGVIFTDVEEGGRSGLIFRDQFGRELRRVFVRPGANGQNQFLGVIFSRPVIARVDVLMGEGGDEFGKVDDVTDGGQFDLVVTDDFVFQRGIVALPTITGVTVRSNGELSVSGIGFADGARIVVDGVSHTTTSNPLAPDRRLGSEEAAAFVAPGLAVEVQVENPDGTLSESVKFTP